MGTEKTTETTPNRTRNQHTNTIEGAARATEKDKLLAELDPTPAKLIDDQFKRWNREVSNMENTVSDHAKMLGDLDHRLGTVQSSIDGGFDTLKKSLDLQFTSHAGELAATSRMLADVKKAVDKVEELVTHPFDPTNAEVFWKNTPAKDRDVWARGARARQEGNMNILQKGVLALEEVSFVRKFVIPGAKLGAAGYATYRGVRAAINGAKIAKNWITG